MIQLEEIAVGTRATPAVDGPALPILCLPGVLGDALVFEPLAALLPHRRVLLADLPLGDPWRAAPILARRLEGLGPFHVLTGSYGGLVAHKLGEHLVASAAHVATLPDLSMREDRRLWTGRVLQRTPAPLVIRLYREHLARSLAQDGLDQAMVQRLLERTRSKEELMDRLWCILNDQLPERPPERPTLWIVGEGDTQAAWSTAEIQAAQPGVQVAHVPGGHRPYATHPQPLVARLEDFWRQVEG